MDDGVLDIGTATTVFDVDFHPSQDVIAASLVNGDVEIHRLSSGSSLQMMRLSHHKDAVRSGRFTLSGKHIVTASSDKSIAVLDTSGNVAWNRFNAHASAVNIAVPFLDSMVASGDDDGAVQIWDCRQPPAVKPLSFAVHTDVISDIVVDQDRAMMITVSGDGSLAVTDLRRGKVTQRTEPCEDELLSVAIIKRGSCVVTGTQEGVLLNWDWGKWAEQDAGEGPERFTGHPASISSIQAIDADTIVTGSEDGLVRILTLRPNKLVGIVGEYGPEGLPVERLSWNKDKVLLATAGHDDRVRVFDVKYLFEDDEDTSGPAGGSSEKSRFTSLPALEMDADADEDEEVEEEEHSASVKSVGRPARRKDPKGPDAGGAGGFYDDLT